MKKRTMLFIVISLVLAFGLAVPAAADAPETVTCWIPWFYSDGTFNRFETEGQLIHNGQGFNLTCPYLFDFSDPTIASIEQACEFFGYFGLLDLCSGGGTNFRLSNWGYYFPYNGEDYVLGDASLHVNATGKAKLVGQYAPGQCSNGELTYSYTLEFPPGYWSLGEHTYTIYLLETDEEFTNTFTVDASAPLVDGQVRLGFAGLSPIAVINPAQDTFMQYTLLWPTVYRPLLDYYHDNDTVTFSWDGSEPLRILAGPITNACTVYNPAFLKRTYGYAR